jgi:excisionase family DNA binding protein
MPHARVTDVPMEHRAAYSLSEVAALTGLSISGQYVLINQGKLRSARVGGRRLVPREALSELLTLVPSKESDRS